MTPKGHFEINRPLHILSYLMLKPFGILVASNVVVSIRRPNGFETKSRVNGPLGPHCSTGPENWYKREVLLYFKVYTHVLEHYGTFSCFDKTFQKRLCNSGTYYSVHYRHSALHCFIVDKESKISYIQGILCFLIRKTKMDEKFILNFQQKITLSSFDQSFME